jgi:hypothetical protein
MTSKGKFHQATLLAVPLCLFFVPQAMAVDCSLPDTNFGVSPGDVFNITATSFTSADIQTSAGYWSSCSGYGSEIPTFQIGGSGGIPVTIIKVVGNSTARDGSCGVSAITPQNRTIVRAEITIWTREADGDSCEPLTDVIAHEFGHLLGLANAPAGVECRGHIMGERTLGSTRTVQSDDCDVADIMWETYPEANPPSDPLCDAYCWTTCVNNACPARTNPYDGCPILIDMENDGIHLTGLNDPVWFDINADGAPDLMSWTDRGEGFLALDRDGNGSIDDGSELFGNFTRLANGSRALNGYLALAELDSWVFSGNGDGVIDADDAAFDSLWLWTDRNHDGESQPEELKTLGEAGVLRIGLDYRRSNRTDRYGNEFRFVSWALKTGRNGFVRPALTWDVFFLVVP